MVVGKKHKTVINFKDILQMHFCFWEWETKHFPRGSIIKAINKTSLDATAGLLCLHGLALEKWLGIRGGEARGGQGCERIEEYSAPSPLCCLHIRPPCQDNEQILLF